MEIPAAAGSFVKYNGTSLSLPPFGRRSEVYFNSISLPRISAIYLWILNKKTLTI
jgi:hypothetical protein